MKELKVHEGFVELLESADELERFLKRLSTGSILTFDWETTGLEYNAIPLGLSLHQKGLRPIFVPVDYFFSKGVPMKDIARLCNEHFKRLKLIAHNAKYDLMISLMNGIMSENINIVADTLVMIHIHNPELDKQLEKRVKADFGYEKKTFEEICGKKWNKIDWSKEGDALLPLLAAYAGEDTYWETKVYEKYKDILQESDWRVHDKIELPLIKILCDAKIRGVQIDVPLLEEMKELALDKREDLITSIYEEAGCVFNLNSNPQKQKVFFEKLKLPVIYTTKSGSPSTNSDTAEEWAAMGYPIGKKLTDYSEIQKLLSGYLDSIPQLVDEHNVLRGDLNSCGTKTGRMSSSNPNLQNQPNNHDFPIRSAFIPRPGYVFVNYDYSQLELRVMAHMSKDEKFVEIFMNGRDPHGEVAKACGISRKQAKVMNFGVLYGMGPDKYMREFGVDKERAIQMIDDYHNTYEGFAHWKESTEAFAKKHGYVKNLFGRVRRFTEVTKNPYKGSIDRKKFFGELRQAVNTVIQGTGADIVKLATIAMCKEFLRRKLDAHFLLQVHDEVLIEARIDQMFEIEQVVIDCMENTTHLDVPLIADGKIIANWGEMKDDNVISLPFRFDYSMYSSLLCS